MIRTPGRLVTIPSMELRHGVRLAVMSASNPAERAQIVHLLLREITDAMTLSTTAGGEAVSVADINDAAARHVKRVGGPVVRSSESPGGAAAEEIVATAMQLSSQPLAPTATGTDRYRRRHELAEDVWDASGLSERSAVLSVNHVESGRNC